MSQPSVKLFGKPGCEFCEECRMYLVGHSIGFEDFDVDTPDGMAAYAEAGWSDKLPLLIVDGRRYEGIGWRLTGL